MATFQELFGKPRQEYKQAQEQIQRNIQLLRPRTMAELRTATLAGMPRAQTIAEIRKQQVGLLSGVQSQQAEFEKQALEYMRQTATYEQAQAKVNAVMEAIKKTESKFGPGIMSAAYTKRLDPEQRAIYEKYITGKAKEIGKIEAPMFAKIQAEALKKGYQLPTVRELEKSIAKQAQAMVKLGGVQAVQERLSAMGLAKPSYTITTPSIKMERALNLAAWRYSTPSYKVTVPSAKLKALERARQLEAEQNLAAWKYSKPAVTTTTIPAETVSVPIQQQVVPAQPQMVLITPPERKVPAAIDLSRRPFEEGISPFGITRGTITEPIPGVETAKKAEPTIPSWISKTISTLPMAVPPFAALTGVAAITGALAPIIKQAEPIQPVTPRFPVWTYPAELKAKMIEGAKIREERQLAIARKGKEIISSMPPGIATTIISGLPPIAAVKGLLTVMSTIPEWEVKAEESRRLAISTTLKEANLDKYYIEDVAGALKLSNAKDLTAKDAKKISLNEIKLAEAPIIEWNKKQEQILSKSVIPKYRMDTLSEQEKFDIAVTIDPDAFAQYQKNMDKAGWKVGADGKYYNTTYTKLSDANLLYQAGQAGQAAQIGEFGRGLSWANIGSVGLEELWGFYRKAGKGYELMGKDIKTFAKEAIAFGKALPIALAGTKYDIKPLSISFEIPKVPSKIGMIIPFISGPTLLPGAWQTFKGLEAGTRVQRGGGLYGEALGLPPEIIAKRRDIGIKIPSGRVTISTPSTVTLGKDIEVIGGGIEKFGKGVETFGKIWPMTAQITTYAALPQLYTAELALGGLTALKEKQVGEWWKAKWPEVALVGAYGAYRGVQWLRQPIRVRLPPPQEPKIRIKELGFDKSESRYFYFKEEVRFPRRFQFIQPRGEYYLSKIGFGFEPIKITYMKPSVFEQIGYVAIKPSGETKWGFLMQKKVEGIRLPRIAVLEGKAGVIGESLEGLKESPFADLTTQKQLAKVEKIAAKYQPVEYFGAEVTARKVGKVTFVRTSKEITMNIKPISEMERARGVARERIFGFQKELGTYSGKDIFQVGYVSRDITYPFSKPLKLPVTKGMTAMITDTGKSLFTVFPEETKPISTKILKPISTKILFPSKEVVISIQKGAEAAGVKLLPRQKVISLVTQAAKVDLGLASLVKVIPKTTTTTRVIPLTGVMALTQTKSIFWPTPAPPLPIVVTIPKVVTIQSSFSATAPAQAQVPKTVTVLKPVTVQVPRGVTTPGGMAIYGTFPPKRKIPILGVPEMPYPEFMLPKKKKKRRPVGYEVQVRRRRLFRPSGMRYSVPVGEALAIGTKKVLGGAAATFRLVPSRKPLRVTGARVEPGIFGRLFRRGKKPGEYVQVSRRRIITRGEKAEISLMGARARRKRFRFI